MSVRPVCPEPQHYYRARGAIACTDRGKPGMADKNVAPGPTRSLIYYPLARFLVEVARGMIKELVRFSFIRSDQRNDLTAIMVALLRPGAKRRRCRASFNAPLTPG
jgi:hypothetical protein